MVAPVTSAQQLKPGVFRLREYFFGRNAYYAVTSSGQLLGNCIHVMTGTEDDAEIIGRLFRELDEVDRPRLQLVPRTVESAIDGPSPTHPAITAAEQEISDAQVLPFVPAPPDPSMPDVAHQLYALLYGPRPG